MSLNSDPARIGLWATSFGGGVAVQLAAHDDRIKALAVQVHAIAPMAGPTADHAPRRAISMAAGMCPRSRRVLTPGPT